MVGLDQFQLNIDDIMIVIPARGGSKGIKNKNIKKLVGKPLIHYSIEVAQEIVPNEQILVSTDSAEIANCAAEKGIKINKLRPKSLATDTASTYDVLLHEVNKVEKSGWYPKTLVLLQPTSPLRKKEDVVQGIIQFTKTKGIEILVGVKKTAANPYYVLYEENEFGFLERSKKSNFTRRQDCPDVWETNGALYVIKIESLKKYSLANMKKRKGFEMDDISSLDIDTPLDWIIAETIIKQKPLL